MKYKIILEGKPMKKRMPSLLLAALLLVPLVSCSNNVSDSSETKGETDTETAASASSDESVETEAETDPLAELYADLPTGNYDTTLLCSTTKATSPTPS